MKKDINGAKARAMQRAALSARVRRRVILEMRQRGMSQMALAEIMGCTQQYISKKLSGRDTWLDKTIARFAKGLNLEPEWLTTE